MINIRKNQLMTSAGLFCTALEHNKSLIKVDLDEELLDNGYIEKIRSIVQRNIMLTKIYSMRVLKSEKQDINKDIT